MYSQPDSVYSTELAVKNKTLSDNTECDQQTVTKGISEEHVSEKRKNIPEGRSAIQARMIRKGPGV